MKSSGVHISEQSFGMEVEGSDCGDFLEISMNSMTKYCPEYLCTLCDSKV